VDKRCLLLDGDIFAFEAASMAEKEIDWGDDLWTVHSWVDDALRHAKNRIESLKKQLNADLVVFVWSDPTGEYFRKDIMPEYKGNRKSGRKPLALKELKFALAEEYEAFMRPKLEADDVMGILATWDKYKPEYQKIIVSSDKDMKTIPAWLFNPDKDYEPWYQHEEDADLWHMTQTLAGDTTDGYGGCPNIGLDTAASFFNEGLKVEAYEHTFKSGARKGLTETRWRKVHSESLWATVVSLFKKAGLGEEEALRQAQVARICRASDYNFKTKEVKLWKP